MDEILVANFMVFHDVVRPRTYDLWIGDEAWDVDYFLHENPELKRAAVRLADRLRRLAADARRRRARGVPDRGLQRRDDRAHRALPARSATGAIFVGNPDDIVPARSARACRRSATGPSGTTTSPATSPASTRPTRRPRRAPGRARLPPGRAGLHRHRRRVGRRRAAAAAGRRGVPRPGQAARPRPADDRSSPARGSTPRACRRRTGSRCAPTCTTSTATWPHATSPSCRAA